MWVLTGSFRCWKRFTVENRRTRPKIWVAEASNFIWKMRCSGPSCCRHYVWYVNEDADRPTPERNKQSLSMTNTYSYSPTIACS